MVLAIFSLKDNLERVWFFEKTFLVANISIKVVLEISFFLFNNADIQFVETKKLI